VTNSISPKKSSGDVPGRFTPSSLEQEQSNAKAIINKAERFFIMTT